MKKFLFVAIAALFCYGLMACSDDDGGSIPSDLYGYWYGEIRTAATGNLRTISLSLEEDGSGEFIFSSSVYYRVAEFNYTYRGGTVYCDGTIVNQDGDVKRFNQAFAYDGYTLRPIDTYSEFTLTK